MVTENKESRAGPSPRQGRLHPEKNMWGAGRRLGFRPDPQKVAPHLWRQCLLGESARWAALHPLSCSSAGSLLPSDHHLEADQVQSRILPKPWPLTLRQSPGEITSLRREATRGLSLDRAGIFLCLSPALRLYTSLIRVNKLQNGHNRTHRTSSL